MPKVSVIIPTYNCAKYVSEAIESVLAQTYKDYEIIVIDDGSTDNTKEVLSPYIDKGLIRYIYQENNGSSVARNKGINLSRGKYIAFLDADDIWFDNFLKLCVESLDSSGDKVVAVLPGFIERYFDDNGDIVIESICIDKKYVSQCDVKWLYKENLKKYFNLSIIGLFKKKYIDEVNGFDNNLICWEDWNLWIRLLEKGYYPIIVKNVLWAYNKRSYGRISTSQDIYIRFIKSKIRFWDKWAWKCLDEGNESEIWEDRLKWWLGNSKKLKCNVYIRASFLGALLKRLLLYKLYRSIKVKKVFK